MTKCSCMTSVVTTLVLTCVLVLLGCQTVVDRITPASVAPQAPQYLDRDPKDLYSLYELRLMKDTIAIEHRNKQLELLRLAEDDTYAFQDARGFIEPAIAEADELQANIIGDDGNPFSISGMLFLLTGGVVGRSFFKRPGDLTKDEAKAKGAAV